MAVQCFHIILLCLVLLFYTTLCQGQANPADWTNNNQMNGGPEARHYEQCLKPISASTKSIVGACCDEFPCNGTNLRCVNKRCICNPGYFSNKKGQCIDRPKKELNENCEAEIDNCYTAFSHCEEGICVCRDDFVETNGICKPKEYVCPYKKPLLLYHKTVRPCFPDVNATKCPANYFCLLAPVSSPKILSKSGIEEGYCCPVPNVPVPTVGPNSNRTKIFHDVCIYGQPEDEIGKDQCPEEYYMFVGNRNGPICCPEPCLVDKITLNVTEQYPTIVNGKCTYV